MCDLPQPVAEPAPVPRPEDVPFPGCIRLRVDARDVTRRILNVRETIPAPTPGPMTLLFPEWLPGYHAPQAPIELLAGLKIRAGGTDLRWTRHPVNVHAFEVEVPEGADEIDAEFQFLSPTDTSQGRVVVGTELLMLQWNTVLLYPAGYFARRIEVEASLALPEGWQLGCALAASGEDGTARFERVPLDVLVDSPVIAGRHFRRIPLDDAGEVHLSMAADSAELIDATPEQIAPHRALIEQADRLFGTRHFDRYEVLFAISDELGSIGVEHHRSCEAVTIPAYFADWEGSFSRRDTIPHEFIHSWNGKRRRGADSWTPSFDRPIRNSLMWVYEGQTQYWDRVLCARSGLWTRDHALGALALTAATHEVRAGSRWRPMSDTTRDPIIAARAPCPGRAGNAARTIIPKAHWCGSTSTRASARSRATLARSTISRAPSSAAASRATGPPAPIHWTTSWRRWSVWRPATGASSCTSGSRAGTTARPWTGSGAAAIGSSIATSRAPIGRTARRWRATST